MVGTLAASSLFLSVLAPPPTQDVAINSFTSDWQTKTAVSAAENGEVQLFDLKTGEKLASKKFEKNASTAIVVQGRIVAVGQEAEVVIYDFTANKEVRRLKRVEGDVSFFAVSEDGKRLFAEDYQDGTYCWNLETGLNIKLPKGVHYGGGIFKSPDNKYLLSGWREDEFCAVWDIDLSKEVFVVDGTGKEEEVRDLSLNGKFAMTWMPDGKLNVWDLVTNTKVRTSQIEYKEDYDFYLSPDATRMLILNAEGEVSIVPLTTGPTVRLATMDEPLSDGGFSFSMDGKFALIGGASGEVCVFDLSNGKQLWKKNATQ